MSTIDDKLNYLINREPLVGTLGALQDSFPSATATIVLNTNYKYSTLNVTSIISPRGDRTYYGYVWIYKIDENNVETKVLSRETEGTFTDVVNIQDAYKIKIIARQRQNSKAIATYTLSLPS